MERVRRYSLDIILLFALLLPLLALFWPQTFGGKTLLPAENLFLDEPFRTYREALDIPQPHNALLSDLVLQNMQWKQFIRNQIAIGEIPLWNPYQFSGIPFMAAGQASTLYPYSLLYYVLPLPTAYGWVTVLNLWTAGVMMYLFMRGLGVGRAGALLSGLVYELSGFLVTSAVFPMIAGAAAWLPLLLLMIEFVIRRQPHLRGNRSPVPWVIIGALALAFNIFSGHVELTIYTLLIAAYYAAVRLLVQLWRNRSAGRAAWARFGVLAFWLVLMVGLGFLVGAVQFIPLFELVTRNWRSGSATFEQVLGWAHPPRDALLFLMPNFYGNPTHHSYFDWFTLQTITDFTNLAGERIRTIDWGIKNYVEGALYVGILPLALAGWALVSRWLLKRNTDTDEPPYRAIFASLGAIALTFMFGLPTYIVIYLLPGLNQSHTPFRWVYAVTLCVAVLAGFGLEALRDEAVRRAARRWAYGLLALGALVLAGLTASRFLYETIEPLLARIVENMELASQAFSSPQMFYSYEFTNVLVLGALLIGTGVIFLMAARQKGRWSWVAAVLVAVDLLVASWAFNPASDPAWLDFTPPAITWLQEHAGSDWRITSLDDPAHGRVLNPNSGWRYGLYDIRGYDSIIPRQYVDYMSALAPQVQLDFNRIAPLYTADLVGTTQDGVAGVLPPASPLLDLLGVRYIVANRTTNVFGHWQLAYEDEAVRIYENPQAMPRAYAVPVTQWADAWLPNADGQFDYSQLSAPETYTPAVITSDSGREKFLTISIDEPSWVVVNESYFPGWRAFIVPDDPEASETPLDVQLVLGNFQGVYLEEGGDYTLRFVYSPRSFQLGAFFSFVGGVLLLFMGGVWLWRLYIGRGDETNTAARVARNSLAPIILNLFNRGIDFAFAAVMLRILGPADAGLYQYAVVVFVWFDIFTNFGLNTFLTREVARDRDRAGHYFLNTSVMRLILVIVGVLPLAGFIAARQAFVSPALDSTAVLALGLLYIGLLPNSLSTGMTALFYAFEQAEYPSAVATLATISKAVFGLLALVLGYGIVGLAAVSIFTNFITFSVLVYGGRRYLHGLKWRLDRALMWLMARESWPLMINHFLAQIFFQIDIVLIEGIHGARMVGQYGVAYKWVLAINIIPAFFTMALLPVMSRQAHEDREAFKRNFGLGIKLLVALALPVAVFFTLAAHPLTLLLGGAEFLPDGAIALQLMIWSIPIGWMNSLTQYALIALDLQRRITTAFIIAVAFNVIVNLIFIPQYGYRAAALTTIASELILLLPFAWLLRGAIGRLKWFDYIWRPFTAAVVMLVLTVLLQPVQPMLALVGGIGVYVVVLLFLRPFGEEEWARLQPMLPRFLRR